MHIEHIHIYLLNQQLGLLHVADDDAVIDRPFFSSFALRFQRGFKPQQAHSSITY